MSTQLSRSYTCRNDELPVLARFLLFSFRRDAGDFSAFSPKFDEVYQQQFEQRIVQVDEVIEPKSELAQQKALNEKITVELNNLRDPLNHFAAYVDLARAELPIAADGFGIDELRKVIRAHDLEKVIRCLHTTSTTATTHFETLSRYGCKQDLIQLFNNTANSISASKQLLYEMMVNRRNIVQNNQALFNELYEQMTEIMNIGKVLYKSSNPNKAKEYVFTELLKRVSGSGKSSGNSSDESKTAKE